MQAPLFVRPLTDRERDILTAGLRSPAPSRCADAKSCSLPRDRNMSPRLLAPSVGDTLTARNAIHAFDRSGLDALSEGSSCPHRLTAAFDAAAERLCALLHQSAPVVRQGDERLGARPRGGDLCVGSWDEVRHAPG